MDKSWMWKDRRSGEFEKGLELFLNYAFKHSSHGNGMIACPCSECKCGVCVSRPDAKIHLKVFGFLKGYTQWVAHGEFVYSSAPIQTSDNVPHNVSDIGDDMNGLVHETLGIPQQDPAMAGTFESNQELPNSVAEKFYKLIDDSQQELYPGCKNFSKLSFIFRLLHLKCLGKWSNKIFDMLLDLLREAFPEAMEKLPKSYYESEKLMKELGLGYEKYDACPNDCTLYWGVNAKRTCCETCKELRWEASENDPSGEKRKVTRKVLWHFPLKPRLQRLFMSSKTAKHMRWHSEGRTKDGYMRHPADSPAWKTFDYQHTDFSKDPRNVRLGLASDGFNPFKSPHAPGNDIDVYLQPLIKELKELWEMGINTYDASCKQNFQLRAALLWTISDFPGYAVLSGWSTKGKYACPVCHKHTTSQRLRHKDCYMGHRKILDPAHTFRKNSRAFNGKEEHGRAPEKLMGSTILSELKNFQIRFGKLVDDNPTLPFSWKNLSIFFDLPYWKDNLIRHNLDVMHIEKNICDCIVGTLLNLDKNKDDYTARCDLRDMGIRPELHPVEKENGRFYLPPACFTMDRKEKEIFCKVLKKVKVPDGYAANISRCVKVKPVKIYGLKSHDNHILMQQLLPIALRKTLSKAVRSPLIKLSRYFRKLCSKVLCAEDLVHMEMEIAIILCQLERIFPPSFFVIMVHLSIHLATEAKIGGPVHYRWMYPIERYLGTLKSYVRNKSRPEGCIAEGYIAEECLTFCSFFLADYVETKLNRSNRNEDVAKSSSTGLDLFSMSTRPLGKGIPTKFSDEILRKAHQYVLFNCDHVNPYINQHYQLIQERNPRAGKHVIELMHSENFASWFANHIEHSIECKGDTLLMDLKQLAKGPNIVGIQYKGLLVNGFRFHTRELEKKRKTQNSGVMVNATTSSFASAKDNNPILSDLDYYGILTNIIELDYREGRKVLLFECDWVSKGKRLKQDEDGFMLANFSNVKRHNEPYILAVQASQVFYVEDPLENGWHVVITTRPRAEYNMDHVGDVDMYLQSPISNIQLEDDNGDVSYIRDDVQGVGLIPIRPNS
ncbi:uncharacterized protein LOC113771742 [Coffea eugenioides]|uniref:uncharacterized protein LOC113771742 n=1 Tax=Coffea eugenioides TaxID=49369 RepID=UPI000F612E0E|nr:uncharacterized protein LOC113771742 [Coffea eugenioides]